MKSLPLSIIGILGFAQALCAQGLLLAKTYGSDQDSTASPIEYRTAAKFATVTNIVTQSGGSQRILAGCIVRDFAYSEISCPDTLVSQPDADRVTTTIATLKDTIAKWPACHKYLQRYLDSNQFAFDQLKKGYVLTGGRWVGAQAYKSSVAEAQQAQREAREKQLEADRKSALAKAAQLEKKLDSLKAEAVELASSVREPTKIDRRAFALQRKLPKARFANLYDIGPYVFQCVTRGGEQCVLVSRSIATLEDRYIDFWVRPLGDVDVKMESGSEERFPVFVEAKENDTAVKLEKLHNEIESTNRELQTIQAKFQSK